LRTFAPYSHVKHNKEIEMEPLKLDISRVYDFMPANKIEALEAETLKAQATLYEGSGAGNDFLGWLHLPAEITDEQLNQMEKAAASLRGKTDILVVVGIGGSYLGARAVNDALAHNFAHLLKEQKQPHMLFAGHNIGEDYMHELLELLGEKSYSVVVISKSGTTTEPCHCLPLAQGAPGEKSGEKGGKGKDHCSDR
jgi:glucose-6-phosphate isomerase